MAEQFFVYIMTSSRNTVLHTGVTNDLRRRVYEHREKLVDGFTARYNVTKLVYYEPCSDAMNAIAREKQIKAGSRKKKLELVHTINSDWEDLWEKIDGSG